MEKLRVIDFARNHHGYQLVVSNIDELLDEIGLSSNDAVLHQDDAVFLFHLFLKLLGPNYSDCPKSIDFYWLVICGAAEICRFPMNPSLPKK
jgi:hypothetical protein